MFTRVTSAATDASRRFSIGDGARPSPTMASTNTAITPVSTRVRSRIGVAAADRAPNSMRCTAHSRYDAAVRALVVEILESYNYSVLEAESGDAALARSAPQTRRAQNSAKHVETKECINFNTDLRSHREFKYSLKREEAGRCGFLRPAVIRSHLMSSDQSAGRALGMGETLWSAMRMPAALANVSSYSATGSESATIPAPT